MLANAAIRRLEKSPLVGYYCVVQTHPTQTAASAISSLDGSLRSLALLLRTQRK